MTTIWSRAPYPVAPAPFAHVLADDFLPADLFARLAASFPECPPASGPTGFTIHPGDPEFDALMAANPDWRGLAETSDSPEFVRYLLAQFAETFANEAAVDLTHAHHVSYRESRADKERPALAKVEHPADALWVRFDLMQGRTGYVRARHLDHRRRAATVLIYFTDAESSGAEGGDLVLHGRGGRRTVVRPRANRAVMFPCSNDSFHSVTPIRAQAQPRNFVQITLSSSVDLWPAVPRRGLRRAADFVRKVAGRAEAAPA